VEELAKRQAEWEVREKNMSALAHRHDDGDGEPHRLFGRKALTTFSQRSTVTMTPRMGGLHPQVNGPSPPPPTVSKHTINVTLKV
jgi:hypothetical protein